MTTLTYTFSWDKEVTYDGITLPMDTLNRARYASFLSNVLVKEAMNDGYVLNLNASWGTGKTYFLKRWMHELKKQHPVVYIDAWKQDFSNDPMLSVIASIIDQLKAQQPAMETNVHEVMNKFGTFTKAVAPIVAKGLMKKAIGVDLFADQDNPYSKADEKMLGEVATKLTEKMIENHNKTLKSIATFKIAIKEWIEAIQAKTALASHTFIFIDELDSCRPNYAVQMLEVIKHFFDISNIVFVIATDTKQLQHAIKSIYGQGFEAQAYLDRFFYRRCTLGIASKQFFIANHLSNRSDIAEDFKGKVWPCIDSTEDLVALFTQLNHSYNLPLRDLKRLIDKVIAIVRGTDKTVNLVYLVCLFILREQDEKMFNKTIRKQLVMDSSVNKDSYSNINVGFSLQFVTKMGDVYPYNDTLPDRAVIHVRLQKMLDIIYLSCCLSQSELIDKRNEAAKGTDNCDYIFESIYESDNKMKNYQDWVELAIAFDA